MRTLVTARSATGVTSFTSLAVLLPGVGSVVPVATVADAVFVRFPVPAAADGDRVPEIARVAVPPGRRRLGFGWLWARAVARSCGNS